MSAPGAADPPAPAAAMTRPDPVLARVANEHRRLAGFAQRLERGIARPGELTCIFSPGRRPPSAGQIAFAAMARRVVRRKYLQAGRPGVARWLDDHDAALQCVADTSPHCRPSTFAPYQGCVRLAAHATRLRCDDPDLFACVAGYQHLTAWLFQGPDLRFRTHAATSPRLRLLLACWAGYVEHGVGPAAVLIGADAWVLDPGLRPDMPGPNAGAAITDGDRFTGTAA